MIEIFAHISLKLVQLAPLSEQLRVQCNCALVTKLYLKTISLYKIFLIVVIVMGTPYLCIHMYIYSKREREKRFDLCKSIAIAVALVFAPLCVCTTCYANGATAQGA